MALRVLLADESTTIKKVMQLALQDFAVEVKAVHVGVDVVEVARSFQPDIIFADVLLQKKNGYDVCADLKQDSDLKATPVVLMWSSFMDLDEKQAAQCGAENRLEKPFDVESLRQLVLELVPKTRSQRLAHFLKFPDSFAGPLRTEEHIKKEAVQSRPVQAAPVTAPVSVSAPAPAPVSVSVSEAKPGMRPEMKTGAPGEAKPEIRPVAKPNVAASVSQTTPRPESRPAAARADVPPASVRTPIPPPASPSTAAAAPASATPSASTAIPMPPPAKPKPSAPSVSDLVSEAKSAWNMDSFDDISNFAEEDEAASQAAPTHDGKDDADDESFAEFKLTNLTTNLAANRKKSPEASVPKTNAESTDDEDPWSHQDLSAFKIDLPPVSIEGEDFGLEFDLSEKDPEGTGFLLNRQVSRKLEVSDDSSSSPATGGFETDSSSLSLENDSNNLGLDDGLSIDAEDLEEIEMPEHYQAYAPPEEEPMDSGPEIASEIELETEEPFARTRMPQFQLTDLSNEREQPMQLDPIMTSFEAEGPDLLEQAAASRNPKPKGPPGSSTAPGKSPQKIPQLNADQLEEIIRSQSREIIESVVRRIVPDIASDIIKQELQRLLEETAIRETPGRETRR